METQFAAKMKESIEPDDDKQKNEVDNSLPPCNVSLASYKAHLKNDLKKIEGNMTAEKVIDELIKMDKDQNQVSVSFEKA